MVPARADHRRSRHVRHVRRRARHPLTRDGIPPARMPHGGTRMATTTSLREHLVDELHDLFDAEQQLTDALPEMADLATNRQLKTGFRSHLTQTKEHHRRV